MRLHNILLEYDTKITAQRQGPALTARWLEDSSAKREVDGHSAKTPAEILEYLEYSDPTKNKQYMLWIIKQYLAKNFMYEDIEGLKDEIELYHTMKPRLPVEQRDIGRFDLGKFREMMMSYEGSGGDFELAGDVSEEDVDILVNSPQGVLARAKTEKGACEMGKGTKWCTAGTDGSNYADDYIDGSIALEEPYGDGLFIYWEYPGKKKYQIHFGNEDGYDDYTESPMPSVTVMDAQDQTVFEKEPDWLVKRQNHPVVGGLIKAMKTYYGKELKMVDMFNDNDLDEDSDYYTDNPYDSFFDSWIKLNGKSANSLIEEHILEQLPHVTKMDVEDRLKKRYYRGLPFVFLDVNRFKFGLQYVSDLRGQRWPAMEKLIISDFNKIGQILSDKKDIHDEFIKNLTRDFVAFRDTLRGYVQQGAVGTAVVDAFEKNFIDKFTHPLVLQGQGDEIISATNEMWGESYFENAMVDQTYKGYGVDINTIPKLPPVALQELPAIELLKHIELKTLGTGFQISYQSVFASKGNFNREANLFDRMRLSIKPLYYMTQSISRDLPGVGFYDDVTNPSTTKQENTRNGPLLIDLESKLQKAGLDEDQVRNFVGAPSSGFSRTWSWGNLDTTPIIQGITGSRNKQLQDLDASTLQKVKAVYEILSPYMYALDDNLYDTVVNNLKVSPLGKLNNAILSNMYDEILDLKQGSGSMHNIFKTAVARCEVAGELFANQAGQPVQFNNKGGVKNISSVSDDEDREHQSLDYIRVNILQKAPGFQDLPLIAPDLNDPKTKKAYVDISKKVADMSYDQADNYQFDKPRTQADLERFDKLYRSFKPLSSTADDLTGK